jgi:hypothetical protein
MRKIVLNISELEYEKFRLEAIREQKSIQEVLRDRVFYKTFHEDILQSYSDWISHELQELARE